MRLSLDLGLYCGGDEGKDPQMAAFRRFWDEHGDSSFIFSSISLHHYKSGRIDHLSCRLFLDLLGVAPGLLSLVSSIWGKFQHEVTIMKCLVLASE